MARHGTAAREAAFDILRGTGAGQRFEVARDRAVEPLDDRDRRLAQEIAAGVLRSRRELDRRLRGVLAKRWASTDQELRDLLRIGAYQLTHLDRVPAYAAVQSTVEVAKRRAGSRRAAFVNAVLRRLIRDSARRPDAKTPSGSGGGRPETRRLGVSASRCSPSGRLGGSASRSGRVGVLASTYSHPDWLVARWLAHFGAEATEALLRHNNRRPPLVLQPVRCSTAELHQMLAGAGISVHDPPASDGLVVDARRPQDLPGYAEGAFVVQGPAQVRLLREAALAPGAVIWDGCAAPGGKTVMLSRAHRVLASDLDRRRLARLTHTVHRTRAPVSVVAADARRPPFAAGSIDVAWVDAPCTATGTFARHPDARWRVSTRRLLALVRLQRELLEGAATVVRTGGRLVYTTCSLEAEENQQQVDAFLAEHPEFRRARSDVVVFPPETGSDGGYLAVLTRCVRSAAPVAPDTPLGSGPR